jgi:hypothetical protein
MPQSLSKILLHVVFSTKERRPFLREPALRGELHEYLGGILKQIDCQPLIVGGVEDHVHLLTTLSRTWLESVQLADSFAHVRWESAVTVDVTTLDDSFVSEAEWELQPAAANGQMCSSGTRPGKAASTG